MSLCLRRCSGTQTAARSSSGSNFGCSILRKCAAAAAAAAAAALARRYALFLGGARAAQAYLPVRGLLRITPAKPGRTTALRRCRIRGRSGFGSEIRRTSSWGTARRSCSTGAPIHTHTEREREREKTEDRRGECRNDREGESVRDEESEGGRACGRERAREGERAGGRERGSDNPAPVSVCSARAAGV